MTNFETIDKSKRERIINAAMDEFRYGYKKGSTDAIVKKAGISKGLLFHYFDNKENLYKYLTEFALNLMQKEYYEMEYWDSSKGDILDDVVQIIGHNNDILKKHPHIYNFLSGLYANTDDKIGTDIWELFNQKKAEMMRLLYEHCDKSLFKDGIDTQKIFDIIFWAAEGFANNYMDTNQDYIDKLKEYLEVFRKHFYK
ncbi:MAG: TetR/AcrR family transcriptional regulator [Firmicutes bacterium]|nr:TetR/AcrR family transcriptional regulator [Bacillota bacterium]